VDFIARDNRFESLNDPDRLAAILDHLKDSFGGFRDLGVIDSLGTQRTYVGPYDFAGIDYSDQEWYTEVLRTKVYISEVFLGYRQVPHIVIAVKRVLSSGSFYVLRATLDTEKFNHHLAQLEMAGQGDAFIINHEGILQTPSKAYGEVLDRVSLPVPEYSSRTRVHEATGPGAKSLIVGYRYIEGSPFILMVVKNKRELMEPWYSTRKQLIGFLVLSVAVILFVILGGATYLVNQIYIADQRRIMTLHEVEYANKLASIGRIAASIAHEINNPLAIINEKAGLIKDLFTLKKRYAEDAKLMGLVDVVLSSVTRCATITRRLLNFARYMEPNIQPIDIQELVHELIGFHAKEAEYRSITVILDIAPDIPRFESDRGKLQQILLNLVNNALAALDDGGHLTISAKREGSNDVSIKVTDDGCGISEQDLDRVFEPFFSTKSQKGGTGLGLSITYNLVQELQGTITVSSELGKGTTFKIILPLRREKGMEGRNARTTG
jgi:signal transduction histidine kinase